MLVDTRVSQLLQSVKGVFGVLLAFLLRIVAGPWKAAEQNGAHSPCQPIDNACSSNSAEAPGRVLQPACTPCVDAAAVAGAADICSDRNAAAPVQLPDAAKQAMAISCSSMAAAQEMHKRAGRGQPRRPYESPLGDVFPITIKVGDLEPEQLPADAVLKIQDCLDDSTARAGQPCWTLRVSVRRGCVLISVDAVPALLLPSTDYSNTGAAVAVQRPAAPSTPPPPRPPPVFGAARSDSLMSVSGPGQDPAAGPWGVPAQAQGLSALQLTRAVLPQLMEKLQAGVNNQQVADAGRPTLVLVQLHGQQVKATLQPGETEWALQVVIPSATVSNSAATALPAGQWSGTEAGVARSQGVTDVAAKGLVSTSSNTAGVSSGAAFSVSCFSPPPTSTAIAQLGLAMQSSPAYWRQWSEQELLAFHSARKSEEKSERHVTGCPTDGTRQTPQDARSLQAPANSGTWAVQVKLQIWILQAAVQHTGVAKFVVKGSDGGAGVGPSDLLQAALKAKLGSGMEVMRSQEKKGVEIAAGWGRTQASGAVCASLSGCLELQLWVQGGSGYLPVQVLEQHSAQETAQGRLLEVLLEIQLKPASLVRHHTDDEPALLQPVYLQLFSSDVLLNSTHTLLTLPRPATGASQPSMHNASADVFVPVPRMSITRQAPAPFGWWGVDADLALAAAADLLEATQQVWAAADEDVSAQTSHMALLRDICYWLNSVQHAWQRHGWCVSPMTQGPTSNTLSKLSLPPAYRLALGSDLIRYALHSGLPHLHKLLQKQWGHVAAAPPCKSSTGMASHCSTGRMTESQRVAGDTSQIALTRSARWLEFKAAAQHVLGGVFSRARAAVLGYRCTACEEQYRRCLYISFAQACSVISCILGVCGVLMLVRQPNVGSDPMAWLIGLWGMLHTWLFVLSLTAPKGLLLRWLPLAAFGVRVLMATLVSLQVLHMMDSVQKQHDTNTWVVSYALAVLSDRLYILSRLPRPVITVLAVLETKLVFMQARTQQHSLLNSLVGSVVSVMLVPWFIDANARGWLTGVRLQHCTEAASGPTSVPERSLQSSPSGEGVAEAQRPSSPAKGQMSSSKKVQ